jgi:hypothetical protein
MIKYLEANSATCRIPPRSAIRSGPGTRTPRPCGSKSATRRSRHVASPNRPDWSATSPS